MSSGIDFAKKFLAGAVKAFDLPIEDTQAFVALSKAYSEKNASIESAVMELAHGSCHDLTIGLADALGQQTAMSIVDETGMPVHSGLYNSATQQMLDANGVHAIEASVAFWSGITRQSCSARLIEVDELYDISGCDEDAAEIALEDFSLIADFIQEELMPADKPAPVIPTSEISKLPVRKVAALWHWGSLDASRKFERGTSYEGNLFSMSACPDAWRQISKFGGKQLHLKSDTTTLLDMFSITEAKTPSAKALKEEIANWGVDQGLLEHRTLYRVGWYDCELDDMQCLEFNTKEAAEAEAEDDEERTVTEFNTLVGTPALLARHGFREKDIIDLQFAVIEWAREKFAGVVDGVYWAQNHEPFNGWSPRAGLFPFDLSRLAAVDDNPYDEDALKGVSKVKWVEFGNKTIDPETPGL